MVGFSRFVYAQLQAHNYTRAIETGLRLRDTLGKAYYQIKVNLLCVQLSIKLIKGL